MILLQRKIDYRNITQTDFQTFTHIIYTCRFKVRIYCAITPYLLDTESLGFCDALFCKKLPELNSPESFLLNYTLVPNGPTISPLSPLLEGTWLRR